MTHHHSRKQNTTTASNNITNNNCIDPSQGLLSKYSEHIDFVHELLKNVHTTEW